MDSILQSFNDVQLKTQMQSMYGWTEPNTVEFTYVPEHQAPSGSANMTFFRQHYFRFRLRDESNGSKEAKDEN